MATVEVRVATLRDVELIEARPQDVDELWSSTRQTPEEAIAFGINYGEAWIGFIDGEPAGIFGIVRRGEIGCPWAVLTSTIERNPIAFLRACRKPIEHMKASCGTLMNYVDVRNTKVIAWLSWLGFTIHPAEPFGLDGGLFHRFDWKRHV